MIKPIKKKLLNWMLSGYKSRKRAGFQNTAEQALASAKRQIARSSYAFIVTNSDNEAAPDARLVEPIFDDQSFTFWVGTSPSSRKVKQVQANPQVTLAFSSTKDNSTLIVKATASIVDDVATRAKKWKPYWRLFFPEGPKADDYILIKLDAVELEVLDFSQNVVPEPFGLIPQKLIRVGNKWEMDR